MLKTILVCAALLTTAVQANVGKVSEIGEALDLDQYRQEVKTLASDEFEGRAPLSAGEKKTISYLTRQFKEMGLKPAFHGSYTQKVPLAKITADQNMTLKIGDLSLDNGTEFTARTQQIAEKISLDKNEVVFVGYGINAPEYNWNDYANVDVKGKTVIVLVNDPGFASKKDEDFFQGNAMTYYGRWTYKYEEAARQGAKAVFIVHETMPAGYGWGVVQNSNTNTKFTLIDDNNNMSQVGVMGWMHMRAAEKVFEAADMNYRDMQKAAAKPGFKAQPMNLSANLTMNNTIEREESQNVGAILPGTENPDEWVVLHAHWDHLGKAMENGKEVVLNGAVDNASGVAGVLELGRVFKAQSEKKPFKRTLMFSAFTAEETGLIGAEHFAKNPPVPTSQIVGFLNIDGMNVNDGVDYVLQYGGGVSELDTYVENTAKKQGRSVKADPRPQNGLFFRSDHFALAREGVPSVLFMSLGDTDPSFIANKYHKSGDDYFASWTLGGVKQDLDLIGQIMAELANNGDWPQWTTDSEFKQKRQEQRP
ncbi:M28 family peptidase [Alteromonas pelagimontana]|uniref:M28 family peptidase n=1 Tax=Alteromonas pelagimontana TaxID=1858656 RepID=A0A6M4MDT8_9ALTE|nr:M28 family metallopeptidase [Alteromonas pelagimontana]QJR80755.1 M28 family peptidase [Alteromonas pelagimontana]